MVDAVLEIMQKAVVPWSELVETLVQQYLEMEGPKYVIYYLVCSLHNIMPHCSNVQVATRWRFTVPKPLKFTLHKVNFTQI